jgi:hypothetical protein
MRVLFYQQVQHAASAAGVDVSPWLRHLLRQITRKDFLASWYTIAQELFLKLQREAREAKRGLWGAK